MASQLTPRREKSGRTSIRPVLSKESVEKEHSLSIHFYSTMERNVREQVVDQPVAIERRAV
jgi:hypothetical protein